MIVSVPGVCETNPSLADADGARILGGRCRAAEDAWPLVCGGHRAAHDTSQEVAQAIQPPAKDAGHAVALPKGAIDKGEKPDQTALREVSEETGVQANLVTKLADVKYYYVRNWGDRARVFKIVSFYLLLYRSGRLGNIAPEMRIEVQNAFWLPLEDAPTVLSYGGEREVAERALQYLKAHPELGDHATDTTH